MDLTLVQEFADDSRRATTMAEISRRFRSEIKDLGFDHFIALSLCDLQNRPDDAIFLQEYPDGWEDNYVSNGFQHIDPIFTAAQNEHLPFIWNDHVSALEKAQGDIARPQREMLEEADGFGIGNGVSVPIVIPGTFKGCVSVTGADAVISDPAKHSIHLMGLHFYEACRRINKRALRDWPAKEQRALTAKELEVLKWTSTGLTAEDISDLQGVSVNTIRFHMKNAKRKLDANTVTHAVVNAVLSGQMDL